MVILIVEYILFAVDLSQILVPPLSLNSEYTFPFLGTNPSFNSIAQSYGFLVGILSNSFFPNTFFYFQNLLGTNSSTVFPSSIFLTWLFLCVFCFFFLYIDGHYIIFTFSFFQQIFGLQIANQGISRITSVFSKLYISIHALLFMFLINRGFFSFSNLNSFSFANLVSMNKPVALLFNSTFTTILS